VAAAGMDTAQGSWGDQHKMVMPKMLISTKCYSAQWYQLGKDN